jgi:glycine cleavage system aminomethyltransferase T
MPKLIKTSNITDVINVTRDMGDTLNNMFQKTKDLKVAHQSIDAYRTAISGAKAQLIYKKLTGTPESINFFED